MIRLPLQQAFTEPTRKSDWLLLLPQIPHGTAMEQACRSLQAILTICQLETTLAARNDSLCAAVHELLQRTPAPSSHELTSLCGELDHLQRRASQQQDNLARLKHYAVRQAYLAITGGAPSPPPHGSAPTLAATSRPCPPSPCRATSEAARPGKMQRQLMSAHHSPLKLKRKSLRRRL
jgi:hypothetical protein